MLRIASAAACLLILAGCGEDDEDQGARAGGSPALAAHVLVTVQPEGPGGPERERLVTCERLGAGKPACRSLSADDLAPVPRTTPCTAIYGGPAVARVTGTLRGERVNAEFSLEDGCEIDRWERNQALLGPPRQ